MAVSVMQLRKCRSAPPVEAHAAALFEKLKADG